MRDRYAEFQERGAEILAIAPHAPDNARDFFERNDIPFPCLPDPDREVFRMYDVQSSVASLGQRPGLYIVDAEGIVRFSYLGWQQWETPSVEDTLAELDRLA